MRLETARGKAGPVERRLYRSESDRSLVAAGVVALLGTLGANVSRRVLAPWTSRRIVGPLVLIGLAALLLVRR